MLNGGSLAEARLDRYLRKCNADTYTPLDQTDRFLQRLCRDGYLVRIREMDGGEETVEYIAGPRGKIEVGLLGVKGLVTEVYGYSSSLNEEGGGGSAVERENRAVFEDRLRRSLGIKAKDAYHRDGSDADDAGHADADENGGSKRRRRRSRRHADADDDDE